MGVRTTSHVTPLSPDAGLARTRQALTLDGYAYIVGPGAAWDPLAFLESLGTLRPQYEGAIVWDVKAEDAMDDVYHSRNTRALVPHTECYEFDGAPPNLVALWCIDPGTGAGGETTLADGRSLTTQLTCAERQLLHITRTWHSSEGLERLGIVREATHPMLEQMDDHSILRFSLNNMHMSTPDIERLCAKLARWFDETKVEIRIERGALLVWDNHRMLHSRNAFSDRARHLRRVLIDTYA